MKKVTWYHSILLISAFLFTSVAWACDSQNLSNDTSFDNPWHAVMLSSTDINHVANIGNLNKASDNLMQTATAADTATSTELDLVNNRLESLYDRMQTSERVSGQIKTKLYGDNVTGIEKGAEASPKPQGLIARLNLCLDGLDNTQASLSDNLDSIRSSV